MLQRGIETPDMDVRWVSSLSWYFLNFFGLNGLYRLILGSDNCAFSLSLTLRSVIAHVPLLTLFGSPPDASPLPTHFDRPIFPAGVF